MTALKKIRTEIAKLRDSEQHGNTVTLYGWDSMKEKVLKILDKYAEQEPTDENLHREREQAYMQGYEDASKKYRQEPNGDVVSRQAVLATLDDMDNVLDEDRTVKNYKELLKECYEVLPSVRPQQEIVRCSQCKYAEVADSEDSQDGYTCQFHRGSIWFSGSYCSWAERRQDG